MRILKSAQETIASQEEVERMEKLGLSAGMSRPKRPVGSTDEFTDQEIEDAFSFIDLDRNRFLGKKKKIISFLVSQ